MGMYTGTFIIKVFDADAHDKLRYGNLCNFLQECSLAHAEKMGLSYASLLDKGQTWMLKKIKVQLQRRPHTGEELYISTWSRGTKGLRALRDFSIASGDGSRIGAAISEWILVDVAHLRPCPIEQHYPILSIPKGDNPLGEFSSLKNLGELGSLDQRRVRFSELDFNGHLNNARYVSWIEDTLGTFLSREQELSAIEIHYMKAAKLHELVQIDGTHSPHCEHLEQETNACTDIREQFLELSTTGTQGKEALARAKISWR